MEALFVSIGVVALAEMGDKTQLLALVLAARFGRPIPITLGIFAATVVNHALAGAAGAWVMGVVGPDIMRWVLGLAFIGMGIWTLIPDKLASQQAGMNRTGIFATTFLAFFFAEMGDKTQIATVALAAKFASLGAVVAGTTIGMMCANVPVVFLGERITKRLPLRLIRPIAALIFVALGVLALIHDPVSA